MDGKPPVLYLDCHIGACRDVLVDAAPQLPEASQRRRPHPHHKMLILQQHVSHFIHKACGHCKSSLAKCRTAHVMSRICGAFRRATCLPRP